VTVQLFMGNLSQSYGVSTAILDHQVLPATRHRPILIFTCPWGTEGWVDLGGWLYTKTVTHPSSNHLIATRPGVDPVNRKSNILTVMPPNYLSNLPFSSHYHAHCDRLDLFRCSTSKISWSWYIQRTFRRCQIL